MKLDEKAYVINHTKSTPNMTYKKQKENTHHPRVKIHSSSVCSQNGTAL